MEYYVEFVDRWHDQKVQQHQAFADMIGSAMNSQAEDGWVVKSVVPETHDGWFYGVYVTYGRRLDD